MEAESESRAIQDRSQDFRAMSLLLAIGWGVTNLAYASYGIPLNFVLKDELHLSAQQIAAFMALGVFSNYVKPLAGILTDSIPLFRTRRRHYLLFSLLFCGIGWIVLGMVPKQYNIMLITFMLTYSMVMVISTTLGGVMVEVAKRFQAAGRVTAQRIAMFKIGALLGGPIGGYLAAYPFIVTMSLTAGLHFALFPLFYFYLREPQTATLNRAAWSEAGMQFKTLFRSKILLAAAGMICLIAAAPGFGTPLFFHQTDTLKFSKQFIGNLEMVHALFGMMATIFYHRACQRLNLRQLLAWSIIVHALGTLFYLFYGSRESALAITAVEGITQTLAMLPVYDLAARGTPRGSEALGYSVMMSVWNLTNSFSNWSGSWIYDNFHLTFQHLVWINTGTTALVLVAVPFLPLALLRQRDGATEEKA